MKVIQELIAYFERRGRLTPVEIRKLLEQGLLAGDAPANMLNLCDPVGATYYFRVTGDASGSIWGTDIYTGDSALAVAAVHAGILSVGETAVVKVIVVRPLANYQGSVRNGVTSLDYGQYDTAYRLASV